MKEMLDSFALPQFETVIENLEQRADKAAKPLERARIHNLAGDMCVDANQFERAFSYYDKAITAYTAEHQYDFAARLCEKILAFSPRSVRPYSTLAWLALARGRSEEARRRIEQYVEAAHSQGLGRYARPTLSTLAEMTEAGEVLQAIGNGLLQLEDAKAANAVFARMPAA